ncbi:MAG: hypothetical protein GY871_04250 [Actinomycetales bacterium]|nr:hypothetical protein [Actinomycetales bacterium]
MGTRKTFRLLRDIPAVDEGGAHCRIFALSPPHEGHSEVLISQLADLGETFIFPSEGGRVATWARLTGSVKEEPCVSHEEVLSRLGYEAEERSEARPNAALAEQQCRLVGAVREKVIGQMEAWLKATCPNHADYEPGSYEEHFACGFAAAMGVAIDAFDQLDAGLRAEEGEPK